MQEDSLARRSTRQVYQPFIALGMALTVANILAYVVLGKEPSFYQAVWPLVAFGVVIPTVMLIWGRIRARSQRLGGALTIVFAVVLTAALISTALRSDELVDWLLLAILGPIGVSILFDGWRDLKQSR